MLFRRIFLPLIASIVLALSAGLVSAQQSVWVQIEARPSQPSIEARLADYGGRLENVAGFRLRSGWYAVALGPFTPERALAELRALRATRAIPSDSFISDGSSYTQQIYPAGAAGITVQPLGQPDANDATLTAQPPKPSDETPSEARRSERDLNRAEREYLQRALQAYGFYNGGIDGAFGPGTRRAMAAWQVAQGYEETGILTTNQRRELAQSLQTAIDSMGFQQVVDAQAGIGIELPAALVTFETYDAPFARYTGADVQVLLISQTGDRNTLAGLYDVMQTLEIVPQTGPRELGRAQFTLTGADEDIVSYTFARLDGGAVKGFTLVWPAEDELRRKIAVDRMQASFRPTEGVLPDTAGDRSVQRPDLVSGLKIRRPVATASGFYVDADGTVLTTPDVTSKCSRITLGQDVEASIVAVDANLGLALLQPSTRLAPMAVGRISAQIPRLQSDIAVSGYSYGGVLGAPTMTFGKIEDLRGLDGNEAFSRLALNAQPGDAGGPVLGAGGGVVGMLLPRDEDDARALPEGVAFAADAEAIASFLADNGVGLASVGEAGSLAPEDLSTIGSDITVLVECWE